MQFEVQITYRLIIPEEYLLLQVPVFDKVIGSPQAAASSGVKCGVKCEVKCEVKCVAGTEESLLSNEGKHGIIAWYNI